MMEDSHPGEIRKCSLDFLRGMIPHHEAAIKMSESYLSYQGKSDELKTIAQDIITAQKDELKQMNELVKSYEKDGKKDQTKEDAYLEQYSKMFAGDSMSRHMDTSGADSLDQAFAEGMIMHHQMAVDMPGISWNIQTMKRYAPWPRILLMCRRRKLPDGKDPERSAGIPAGINRNKTS